VKGRKFLCLDCDAKIEELCHVYECNGFRKRDARNIGTFWVNRYECELM